MLPEGFELVLDAQHFLVGQQRPEGHVWVERKPTGVLSGPDFVAAYNEVSMALARLPKGAGVVIDSRAARGNNDPSFESAIQEVQRTFFPRFAKRAVIVESAIGQLQADRLEKKNQSTAGLFASVADALAYIRAES